MNIRSTYVIMAILVTGTVSIYPAFALQQACPDCPSDGTAVVLDYQPPIRIWTDKTVYDHDSTIMINGQVNNLKGQPVTLRVTSPLGNVIGIEQIDLGSSTTFSTTMKTSGGLWKYDGTYRIQAFYGSQEVNDKVLVELTGGMMETPSCTGPGEYIENGVCVPEFGTIAVMILAVSIIAIIAVSARSRLSILPKF